MEMTPEIIAKNKETFCQILRTVKREGADIERLITKLERSDFFDINKLVSEIEVLL